MSKLELDTNFHYLCTGNIKVGAGLLCIVMHKRENRFPPLRHFGSSSCGNDGLVTGKVSNLRQIAGCNLPAGHSHLEALLNVGFFHKSELQCNPSDSVGEGRDRDAIFIANTRSLGHFYCDQKHPFVQHVVEIHVERQR